MSRSISIIGVLAFEDDRLEIIADQQPRLPWLGTALGPILAAAGRAMLVG